MVTGTIAQDRSAESVGTLARGAFVNVVGSAFNVTSRLVYNLALARMLGASQVGLYYLALTMGTILSLAAVGGFNSALLRYLAVYRDEQNWGAFRGTLRFAVRVVAAIGFLGSLVMFFGAHWIAGPLFHKPGLVVPLRLFALYVPLFAIEQLLLAATQSFKRMKYKAYVESMLNPGLRLLFLVVIYFVGGGLNAVMISYVVSVLICAVVSYPALKSCLSVKLDDFAPICNRAELLRYTIPLLGVNVLSYELGFADTFVLAHFRSASEVGLYSVCLRLMMVTAFALPVVVQIFSPLIAELHHRREIQQLGTYFKVVTLWAIEIFLPLTIMFIVLPRPILALFGREFPAAAGALAILAVGQIANVMTGPVGEILCMSGWTRLVLWDTIALLMLQLTLSFLLIPRWGFMGAAVANGAALLGTNILQVLQVYGRLRIQPFSWPLIKPLLACLVAAGCAIPFWQSSVPMNLRRMLLLYGAMLFAYVGMLMAFGLDHYSRLAWDQLRGSLQQYFPGLAARFSFVSGAR